MTNYTKPPWGIVAEAPKASEGGATAYIIGNKDWTIKDMTGPSQATNDENIVCIVPHHNLKTDDGNLKLICAAPELFVWCQKLYNIALAAVPYVEAAASRCVLSKELAPELRKTLEEFENNMLTHIDNLSPRA